MEKPRVLHIITRLDRGGSPDTTLLTLIGIADSFDLTLLYGLTQDFPSELAEKAKEKGVRFIFLPSLVRGISPFKDLLAFFSLFFLIKKEKFDIIHTHTSKAGILGRFAAKLASGGRYHPLIIHTPHGHVFYGYYGTVLSKLFLALERITANFTDKIVTLTERGIDEHISFGVGRGRSKFTAIPIGVDLKRIENLEIDSVKKRNEMGLPEWVKLIGSAGRFEPVKGYKYFVEAGFIVKKTFPDCLFLLIGDGKLRGELERQISKLSLEQNFRILGWRNDAIEIISLLDIFVLSSLNEGMGRVLVEAMAMGKPVVATNVGGIPEVVEDKKTGLLIPSKDSKKLAEAIIELLEDSKRAKKMGEEGKRKVITTFGVDVMVKKIEDLYEELMRSKKMSSTNRNARTYLYED